MQADPKTGDASPRTGTDQLRDQLMHAPEMQFDNSDGPPTPPPLDQDPRDTGGDNGRDAPQGAGRGEVWPGCPVKPLGVYGDNCYYLDVLGQLRQVDNHSLDKIRNLFGGRSELLSNHFPQYDQHGKRKAMKFDQAMAAAALNLACSEQAGWSPTGRARGAGCWTDEDGQLIYHAGDAVLIDGEWQPPGVYDGKVYSAADPIPRPADSEGRIDPADKLLEVL